MDYYSKQIDIVCRVDNKEIFTCNIPNQERRSHSSVSE